MEKSLQRYLFCIALICLITGGLYGQTLGDVNNSNSVDIVDALLIARWVSGLNPAGFNTAVADVDVSGAINIVDAMLVAQFEAGIITRLPGQTSSPTPAPTATPTATPTPTPTVVPSGNLVVNGDFESGQLSPWTIWNAARIGDWKAASGLYCAAVGPNAPASIEQVIQVEPNTIYELSGYLLVDNAGEQVSLGVKNYGGAETSQPVTVKAFTYVSLRFTTRENTATATIYIYKSSGTGWGYGDDIKVVKVGVSSGIQPPPVAGNWQLVFQDEFNGTTLDTSKWSTGYPWGNTHNHRAYMDPANVIVQNGLLRLKAENRRHPDAPDGIQRDDFGWLSLDYTSGCVTTSGKFHISSGYMEAALKMPATRGFWPAFWTLGSGWPPEIDIMEFLSSVQTRFYTNYHWGTPQYGSHFVEHRGPDFTQAFHVFAVEWDSTHMAWFLDGTEIARFTSSYCSQAVNQYILLNLAVGGWEEDPDSSTAWPGWFEVDWVRVWQKR